MEATTLLCAKYMNIKKQLDSIDRGFGSVFGCFNSAINILDHNSFMAKSSTGTKFKIFHNGATN